MKLPVLIGWARTSAAASRLNKCYPGVFAGQEGGYTAGYDIYAFEERVKEAINALEIEIQAAPDIYELVKDRK